MIRGSAIPSIVPRVQPGFVIRPELDAMLDALPQGGWLSVVAPAGFGKSQLAAYWYERAVAKGGDARWGEAEVARPAALHIVDDASEAPDGSTRLVTFSRTPIATGERTPDALVGAEELRLGLSASAALVGARGGATVDHTTLLACEGWPPALNLLAFGADDTLESYLEHQVMRGLDGADRAALADLALLPDLREPLVAAALELDDAAPLLRRLAQDTPFFRVVEGGFALAGFAQRFLASRERTEPAQLVHRRAAEWLAAQGSIAAVPHFLLLGEIDRAATILSERLFDLVAGGNPHTAVEWLDQIGPDRIARDRALSVSAAHAYATAGDHAQANRYLAGHVQDERLVLQATLASYADDADTGAHILSQVTDPESLGTVTSAIHRNLLSWIEQKRGRWSDVLNRSLLGSYRDTPELMLSHAYGRSRVARWELNQGRAATVIDLLEPLLQEGDARLGRMSSPSGLIAANLAYAYVQLGDNDSAARAIAGRLDSVRTHHVAATWAMGLIAQSRLAAARDDHDGAIAALDQLDAFASSRDVFSLQSMVIAERIRLMVRGGRLAGAMTLAGALERLCTDTRALRINGPQVRLDAVIGLGHLALAQGNAQGARRLFQEARTLAFDLQRPIDAAEIMLVCPEALSSAQRQLIARKVDKRDMAAMALRLGRPLAEPEPAADIAQADVRILDHQRSAVSLTAREIDVLVQLALHRSNKMIAREIGLSGETVKWHVANILAKLGARDRSHAVERARAVGLLPSVLTP